MGQEYAREAGVMVSFDDLRAFFGFERKRLHPLWIELFRRIDADGSKPATDELDPEALLVSLSHGFAVYEGERIVLTDKGRRAAYSKARP